MGALFCKFKVGDKVRHRDWPKWRVEEITAVEEDRGGWWVTVTSGGTFGEGAVSRVEASE